ncbi:MAG: glycerate kinase [Lentihominibacter sp.]
MKKCIIIPDSFKGTMSSQEVCSIIEKSVKEHYPQCDVTSIPVADGGEGTVDCFLASMQGEKVYVTVENAFGENTGCFYGRFDDMDVIEMAASAGMVSNVKRDPMTASTYGVGQLIKHAITGGCTKIILGLGGSCTNDAGAGMAAALGTVFCDSEGRSFIPSGGTLADVCTIDNSRTEKLLSGIEVCCMCDISNTMYGREGAAYVFAPQKGADREQVKLLDYNLRRFAETINNCMNIDVSELVSGGAAGGMGAGAYVFLGAKLESGIELMLDVVGFDSRLENCDCVFTGEGRFDSQSLGGKVVVGVAGRAKAYGVPVIAVAGAADDNIDSRLLQDIGIVRLYTTSKEKESMEEIRRNCRGNLSAAMDKIMCEIDIIEKPV